MQKARGRDGNTLWDGRGGEVREKVEGQQYTGIVPSSMGATITSWVKIPTINECISSL
jgi:hypothetical protein